MTSVVAIVGPTAVGKSDMALSLGRIFDGEIVNADSRQVYRYMDIGTAKPAPEERAQVPHHLLDVVYPGQSFNLALYQNMARKAIRDIQKRGKLPLLVGGSGLYIWALLEGWHIPPVPPDQAMRHELEARARDEGVAGLYEELKQLDSDAAQRIDPKNARRIIRAIEISRQGKTSRRSRKKGPAVNSLVIGLTTERSDLYRAIDERVDRMMAGGLLAEVEKLVEKGYGFDLPSMSGLGYKQIGMFLRGEIDLPAAVQRVKFETHRFARHQYNWFRLDDERIHWFDVRSRGTRRAIRDLVHEYTVGCSNQELEN